MTPADLIGTGPLDAWVRFGAILITVGVGAYQSYRAKKLSEPTGNGFGKATADSLRRIEDKLDEYVEKLDEHVAGHAEPPRRRSAKR